jgi:ADP-ribose pyrophosphatase
MPTSPLSREIKYQGPIFNVVSVTVSLPDSRKREYDLVEHGDSVSILPIDDAGNVYLVTQHRIGADSQILELPAGVLEKGEDPLVTARRELREEIGKDAQHFQTLGGFFIAPGYTDEYMTVFLATGLHDSPLPPDDDEFLKVSSMPIATLHRLAQEGEINDVKTLATLLLAKPFLEINE